MHKNKKKLVYNKPWCDGVSNTISIYGIFRKKIFFFLEIAKR